MKAAVYTRYGSPSVLHLTEREKPVPQDNEILVKVHATLVTSGDVRLRKSDFPPLFWLPARLIFGLFKPKKQILGHEFAGVVEGVGKGVTRFQVGDEVFGTTTLHPHGAYAEYTCVPERWKRGVIERKPTHTSFREAATLPIGSMTALFLLEKGGIAAGQRVLVYGASGSVGSYAVQLARHFGASVTGVCSTPNVEMVRSLGADHVIDYKKEDYTAGKTRYDLIFDAVGKTNKSQACNVLDTNGAFVSVTMMTQEKDEHLALVKELAEKGELAAFIDRVYPLDQIVEAHTYVEQGHKRGNVAIEVQS